MLREAAPGDDVREAHKNDTPLVQGSGLVRKASNEERKGTKKQGQLLHLACVGVLTCQPVGSSGFQSGCDCPPPACTLSSCQH
jgi:hypothetical protein